MIPSDDYLSKAESLRLRKHLHPSLKKAMQNALEAFVAYVETVYDLDDLASEYWPSESGAIQPGGQKGNGGGVRSVRNPQLDSYLRRDVRNDLESLGRTIDHRRNRVVELLMGGKPKRRLSRGQVSEIRRRPSATHTELAAEYGVSRQAVADVRLGKTHRGDEHKSDA